ncbi:MAG: NOP5/NOP56 family protein [Nanopusillaceae archaeon]|jgi:nucleolar protein 56
MRYLLLRYNGLYVFDENLQNYEFKKIEFNIEELKEIGKNKLPDKVKELINKDDVFVGQKFEGYNYIEDKEIIRKVLEKVKEEINNELFINLLKEQISDSVSRDELIIQAINFLDDLNKAINLFVERFREWYGLYLPEISQEIEDHEKFIKTIVDKKREELMEKYNINNTMGGKIFIDGDFEIINDIANRIKDLYNLRKKIENYIEELMKDVAPNLSEIATPNIGARLIALAGGLKELSLLPSSTIQVLGAEKALFLHLTKGIKPPKHGVIFNHPYLQKLPPKKKGSMARTLASKIAIAARVDSTDKKIMYDRLKKELEERFNELSQK